MIPKAKKEKLDKEDDLRSEMSSIIDNLKTLRIAIEAIEGGMLKLTTRIEEMEKERKDKKSDFEEKLIVSEKNLDGKISTYQ